MKSAIVAAILIAGAGVTAQQGRSAQQLFEAGQDDQALAAIAEERERGSAGPDDTYLAGQILLRMNQNDNASREFQNLAENSDELWRLVGESAVALIGGDTGRALDTSTRAVGMAGDRFHAQYQLGLVNARVEDWAGAAEAFGRAAQLNPTFAYAHYYAGLAYSRIKRPDLTAEYLERFIRLAPKAPERPAVESVMRTIRGR